MPLRCSTLLVLVSLLSFAGCSGDPFFSASCSEDTAAFAGAEGTPLYCGFGSDFPDDATATLDGNSGEFDRGGPGFSRELPGRLNAWVAFAPEGSSGEDHTLLLTVGGEVRVLTWDAEGRIAECGFSECRFDRRDVETCLVSAQLPPLDYEARDRCRESSNCVWGESVCEQKWDCSLVPDGTDCVEASP